MEGLRISFAIHVVLELFTKMNAEESILLSSSVVVYIRD